MYMHHAQLFRCVARRPPYSSRFPTRAHYSQSVPSFTAALIQEPDTPIPAGPNERLRTATTDSHHAVGDSRNPLDPTRLDRYLTSIRATDSEPSLDDVERCKPKSFSRPDSSRYAAEYTSVLETLCRCFSKDQLRRFTELYKLDAIWTRSSRRKTEYAESIIEKAWGWPSLKEIERKRRDITEVLVKSFTVTPGQLFLIMGKDGADLLQLSMQYNVHISLTSNPLALRVEGLRGSLKGVAEYISTFKKGIIDEVFDLPTGLPVRPDLLQSISRLAGAYVQNHGNRGKIRICAKDSSDTTTAQQLALRASMEVGPQACTVCYDPPVKSRDLPVEVTELPRYSIYPFVTPHPLPWIMHSGVAFRLRRVSDWLGVDSCEDIVSTGGLADNSYRLLKLDRSGTGLAQLCRIVPERTLYRQRTITASLGHILISSNDASQRGTICPPTKDPLSLHDMLERVEALGTPLTFVSSVPSALMTIPSGKQKSLYRLVYKTLPQPIGQAPRLPQHVLRFEIELPETTQSLGKLQDLKSTPLSDKWKPHAENHTPQEVTFQPAALPESLRNQRSSSCRVGSEMQVNLMLPDRPMDLQLCIFDWDNLSSTQQPQALQDYAAKLSDFSINKTHLSQLPPPSTFSYEGRVYHLYNSLSLRHSQDATFSSSIHVDDSVQVCNESIADLQSSRKTELCQVKFHGTTGGPDWNRFLTTCDQLSVMSESRRKAKPQIPYLEK